MKGLVVHQGRATLHTDLPRPAPAPGESRVRVVRAGVCATDLALVRGYMDFRGVPGHEFVGVALDGPLAGRRVVGEINGACGRCATCRAGRPTHCPERDVLGILGRPGAFAEELRLPDACLHPVPEGLDDDAATFTEPLAAAFRVLEQVPVDDGTRALVVGDGRLGLLCAQVLADRLGHCEVVGRHPERARDFPRLAWVAPPRDRRHDLLVEATGRPELLPSVLTWVRPGGHVVLKTTAERGADLDLAPLVVDEITLVGSRCGPFPPALEALAAGRVDVRPLVRARFPLERAAEALEAAARPGALKVLLDVG